MVWSLLSRVPGFGTWYTEEKSVGVITRCYPDIYNELGPPIRLPTMLFRRLLRSAMREW